MPRLARAPRAPRAPRAAQSPLGAKQEAASLTAICEGTRLGVAGGGVPFAYTPTWRNRNTNGQVKTPRLGWAFFKSKVAKTVNRPPRLPTNIMGRFFWFRV